MIITEVVQILSSASIMLAVEVKFLNTLFRLTLPNNTNNTDCIFIVKAADRTNMHIIKCPACIWTGVCGVHLRFNQ